MVRQLMHDPIFIAQIIWHRSENCNGLLMNRVNAHIHEKFVK